ncbi:MAG: hypothetical protein LBV04_10200 [Deferribacteraceae bacterium]|jgi:hypothetical protein|nr:hypothetical protein [Deferribacteraceae bacterium]
MYIVVIIAVLAFSLNIPLGAWRARQRKFSARWFIGIHASVPLIVALRIYFDVHTGFIALFIALAVLGQLVGALFWRN